MDDFPAFVYWVLDHGTWRGIVFGGLLLGFVLPALIELVNWRRG